MLVLLVRALAHDPAGVAMLAPQSCIDAVLGIERRHDDIGHLGIAFGMAGLAGQRETELPELRAAGKRSGSASVGLGSGLGHLDMAPWLLWHEAVACARDQLGSAVAFAAGAAAPGFLQALEDDRDQRHQHQWQRAVQGMVHHAGELRLQRAGFVLQGFDRGAVNFGGQFEFAACGRPSANHEQDWPRSRN